MSAAPQISLASRPPVGRVANAIEVESLTKVYSDGTRAVDCISFTVEEGEIFGLLGPNGAGKTTTLKMLTTLASPTSGGISVMGIDAVSSPRAVRRVLGYVPQTLSADGDLSGYENLLIFAKLFHVKREDRPRRIREALEYMNLEKRADDLVKHYSGGMMRRLEIAQALVNRPRVLFLDEPTIGLDPTSKTQVWGYIKQLKAEFDTTVLITTHDMEEADELCDRLAIMNAGKIATFGSPEELKKSVGEDIITVTITEGQFLPFPADIGTVVSSEANTLKIRVADGRKAIPRVVYHLERSGAALDTVTLTRPTLGDVFLKYGGASLESGSMREVRAERRSFTRHGGGGS